jgi:hypothetical protein
MANTILLKRSDVANSIPAAGNLVPGEVALNFADGNLFFKDLSNNVVLLASTKLVTVTGNVTGDNIIGNTSGRFGNITISGSNVNTDAGFVTINSDNLAVDFAVNGNGVANIFYVDADTATVSIGNSTQVTNAVLTLNSTNSMVVPVGDQNQRPDPAQVGMLRFNTDDDSVEFYTNINGWKSAAQDFTLIASETFTGSGYSTVFTLATPQTTDSVIVSLNGVVQIPNLAYTVSGTTLTFTAAPGPGYTIEVRSLTTTTSVTQISNSPGTAVVSTSSNSSTVDITGNLIPTSNAMQTLGNATNSWKRLFVSEADVAENYLADADYEPGTVMVFGGTAEVTMAEHYADTRIAGVITTSPAYVMNAGLTGNHVATVALLGRVPCRVLGPISKGSMLVSAGDGYAAACTEPKLGTVIGKALENFNGTEGVIEVVVGKI